MGGATLFFEYFLWHYSQASINGATIWANLMWFVVHFFSIPLLVRTLFSPWKRMKEQYSRGGLEDLMGMVVVNIMTRIIGFLVRSLVLIVGITFFILTATGFLLWCVVWFFLPFLTVCSIFAGIWVLTL